MVIYVVYLLTQQGVPVQESSQWLDEGAINSRCAVWRRQHIDVLLESWARGFGLFPNRVLGVRLQKGFKGLDLAFNLEQGITFFYHKRNIMRVTAGAAFFDITLSALTIEPKPLISLPIIDIVLSALWRNFQKHQNRRGTCHQQKPAENC